MILPQFFRWNLKHTKSLSLRVETPLDVTNIIASKSGHCFFAFALSQFLFSLLLSPFLLPVLLDLLLEPFGERDRLARNCSATCFLELRVVFRIGCR